MNLLRNIAAVFHFEWRRSLGVSRAIWWGVLAAIPVVIMALMRFSGAEPPIEAIAVTLFGLVPMVVCMLGVFLWATPAVSAEVERESWVYLAVRPHGAMAILLGKYLVAVSWTVPAAIAGLTIAVLVAPDGGSLQQRDFLRQSQPGLSPAIVESDTDVEPTTKVTRLAIWMTHSRLAVLSAIAYGAVYALIGVLFVKRAMVVAVFYTLIFEIAVAMIPAMINKFTIQYRLRSLGMNWLQIPLDAGRGGPPAGFFSDASSWHNVTIVLGLTLALLVLAAIVIRLREFGSATSD